MGLKAAATKDAWLLAPSPLHLPGTELHLWRADAVSFSMHERMLTALLSKAEREKANSFMQRADRSRSILGRGVLRDILGRYMNLDPRSLKFQLAGEGKPVLDPKLYADAPHFSVSHSGNVVLFAFARKHDVGVDVEAIRSNVEVAEIAQRFFAPSEIGELMALSANSRLRAFFDGWTRKEAYLKARGEGIGSGLSRFAVTLAPAEPVRLVSDARYPDEVASWCLHDVPLGQDYAAATAVRCGSLRMRYWLW